MLNQLLKKIFIACFLFVMTFCPVYAIDSSNTIDNSIKFVQQDVTVNDYDIAPLNTEEVKKTVIPDPKKESKKVITYFLRVMSGVIISAFILYVVLKFIKKYYGSAFVNPENEEYFESFDLSTPKTKQEALKSFLNRTK